MRQLVSIYQRKQCFLMHPNSRQGERGVWVAHQPGLGVSEEASDEMLGQLVHLLLSHSKQNLPPQNLRSGIAFPLGSIAGLQSWGALAKSSPTMVQVEFSSEGAKIEKYVRDGQGYSADSGSSHMLPFPASAVAIGAAVREMFANAA